jgi:hypothetical protein
VALQNNFIGIVCGLASEAQCIPSTIDATAIRIEVSGADASRALHLSKKLIDMGATGLLSFGISGSLSPTAETGTLLIANMIVLPTQESVTSSQDWVSRLQDAAYASALPLQTVSMYGSNSLIGSPEEKAELFRKTSAIAVDMESAGVACAASVAGRPFAALRAIADPAHRSIPASAAKVVRIDGGIRPLAALGALVRKPADLGTYIRLGQDSQKGLASLRRGADELLPVLLGSL